MKKLNKVLYLFLCIAMILSFSACGNTSNKNTGSSESKSIETKDKNKSYPKNIKDFLGKELTLDKEPTRVISLAPSATETIFALGRGNLLVGRTDYCNYPKEATKIESIGKLQEPNIEKIISLKPDVVFATSLTKPDIIKKLQDANIKVLNVLENTMNFEDVYRNITLFGDALNAKDKSDEIIKDMKDKVISISNKTKNTQKPKVYYVISYGEAGDYTATGDTFISELINLAGADNIAKGAKGWKYTKEKIIANNPDIIIVSKYMDSKKGFMSDSSYKSLKAVQENKVFEIDNNNLDIPGPRLLDGLEELTKIIHPELFK